MKSIPIEDSFFDNSLRDKFLYLSTKCFSCNLFSFENWLKQFRKIFKFMEENGGFFQFRFSFSFFSLSLSLVLATFDQCDQIGRFLKVLGDKFDNKSIQTT